MTLRSLLNDAKCTLINKKIDNAEFDATEILLYLLDMDMARFLYMCDEELESEFDERTISNILSDFDELISARAMHFPLQYILGEAYFCGLRFMVNKNVLIPRQDTETLVEKVLLDNNDRNKNLLDICTGSGCIAIALAKLGKFKTIVGTDISDEALEIAVKNAEEILDDINIDDEIKKEIYFIKSDLFDNMNKIKSKLGIEKFDVITANPPYIRSNDIMSLSEEIRKYEPHIALDGDKDGLKFYKKIAKEVRKYLNDDGKIYLEIGYNQAKDVIDIFCSENLELVDLIKDLSNNDRVLIFK